MIDGKDTQLAASQNIADTKANRIRLISGRAGGIPYFIIFFLFGVYISYNRPHLRQSARQTDRFTNGVHSSRINYQSVEYNKRVPDSYFAKPSNAKEAKKDLKL